MDDEDAYEAELIDEFDAPSALLQTHARVSSPVYQPPPQPVVSAQSVRYSSPYTSAHVAPVAAANPSTLYPHMMLKETRDPAPQYVASSGEDFGGDVFLYPRFEEGSRSVIAGNGKVGRSSLVSGFATGVALARQHSYPVINDSNYVKDDRNAIEARGAPVSVVNASSRDSEVQIPQPRRTDFTANTSSLGSSDGVGINTAETMPLMKQQSDPVVNASYSSKVAHKVQETVVSAVDSSRYEYGVQKPQKRQPNQPEVPTSHQLGGCVPLAVPVQPGASVSKSVGDERNAHKLSEAAVSEVNSSRRDDEAVEVLRTRQRHPYQLVNPTDLQVGDHATRTDPVRPEVEVLPVLSDQDFKARQREIVKELAGYQHQLNYIAQALAGDTPHQRDERKRRELERQERDHQRAVAMEHRIQHQIDRAHERDERRAKILSRANRASRSPSPEPREHEPNEAQEFVTRV